MIDLNNKDSGSERRKNLVRIPVYSACITHGTYLLTDAERSDGDVGDVPVKVGLRVRGEAHGGRRRQKQGSGELPTPRRHRALARVED